MINLFAYSKPQVGGEELTELFNNQKVVINRIVSNEVEESGWYEQEEDEWFVLLEGEALLELDNEVLTLKKGDTMFIPAFTLHRVKKTSTSALWLTVHIAT